MKESWNWPKIRIAQRIRVNPDARDYAQKAVDESCAPEAVDVHQSEALARAWDEGEKAGLDTYAGYSAGYQRKVHINPYRSEDRNE